MDEHMSIIRSPRKHQGFTIISNSVAQDPRLSMRALGLLVRLLSRPDNWETNSSILAREFDVGREQMQGVLRELSLIGYMRLVKNRQEDGTFFSRWHVYDEPEAGEPGYGKPEPENPYAGKPVAINKSQFNKEPTQRESAPLRSALFDKFWNHYPKKVAKDAAEKAFNKRKPDENLALEMIQAVEQQAASEAWTKEGGKYIPNPATWLNQGRWKDSEQSSTAVNMFAGAI